MQFWRRRRTKRIPDLRKSFLLPHKGSEVWICCIDNLDDDINLIQEKVSSTEKLITNSIRSSSVLYHLDGTDISPETVKIIIDSLMRSQRKIRRLALMGLTRKGRALVNRYIKSADVNFVFAFKYFDSLDLAKDWLVREGN